MKKDALFSALLILVVGLTVVWPAILLVVQWKFLIMEILLELAMMVQKTVLTYMAKDVSNVQEVLENTAMEVHQELLLVLPAEKENTIQKPVNLKNQLKDPAEVVIVAQAVTAEVVIAEVEVEVVTVEQDLMNLLHQNPLNLHQLKEAMEKCIVLIPSGCACLRTNASHCPISVMDLKNGEMLVGLQIVMMDPMKNWVTAAI